MFSAVVGPAGPYAHWILINAFHFRGFYVNVHPILPKKSWGPNSLWVIFHHFYHFGCCLINYFMCWSFVNESKIHLPKYMRDLTYSWFHFLKLKKNPHNILFLHNNLFKTMLKGFQEFRVGTATWELLFYIWWDEAFNIYSLCFHERDSTIYQK